MTDDEKLNKGTDEDPEANKGDDTSAETIKPDTTEPGDEKDYMVTKTRLDQEIAKRQEAAKALKTLERKVAKESEDRLVEDKKWQELAEKRAEQLDALKPIVDEIDASKQVLEDLLAAQMADIPEEMQGLVPDELTTRQKLAWIAKNKTLLMKPVAASDIGGGNRGGNKPINTKLTQEEKDTAASFGMAETEYDALMKGDFSQSSKKE